MKPLYIEGAPGCRVVLDEPALRVSLPEKADQLFPLSRISRVVCKGVVEWSMSALLACADAGIFVLFLEKNGELRARWSGRGGERQAMAQRLVDLLARADGPALYENWMRSMEKLAARSFARRIGMADWREAPVIGLRFQVADLLGTEGRHRAHLLLSLLHAEVLLWLPEAGFGGDDEALQDGDFDLAAFLSRLLLWDFYPVLLDAETAAGKEPPMQAMAALFHQREDRCYLLFRGTINKLHQFLLSVS
jgi:hypothetical protein